MVSKGMLNSILSAFTEVIYTIGQQIGRRKELHTMVPRVTAERNWLAMRAYTPNYFIPQWSHHTQPKAHYMEKGKAVTSFWLLK